MKNETRDILVQRLETEIIGYLQERRDRRGNDPVDWMDLDIEVAELDDEGLFFCEPSYNLFKKMSKEGKIIMGEDERISLPALP